MPLSASALISIDSFTDTYKTSYKAYYDKLTQVKQMISNGTLSGADALVEVAKSQVGLTYPESAYWCWGSNAAWCNAFVAWCGYQSGLGGDIIAGANRGTRVISPSSSARYTYGIGAMIDQYKVWGNYTSYSRNGRVGEIQRGDIIFCEGTAHVSIVKDVSGDTIYCIDGNWGNSVKEQTRFKDNSKNTGTNTKITGVARPHYCSHDSNYTSHGRCDNCKAWNPGAPVSVTTGTYKVSSGKTAYLRVHPYEISNAANGEPAIALSAGAQVTVTGGVKNSIGNIWYEVTYGNEKGYIYSGNLTFVSAPASTLKISPEKDTYTITKGSICNLRGTITSNYTITSVVATLEGHTPKEYANFNPKSTSVDMYDYASNRLNSFDAGSLSVGTHKLYIVAKDSSNKTKDATIYIVVTTPSAPATYTVSYNANGGSGAPSSQTKTHGQNLTLSSTKPTRTGYTFQGWATSSGGGVSYQPGSTYSNNAAVTLYAVWKVNTYTVYFNAFGGSPNSSVNKTYGSALGTLPTPSYKGYLFGGWYTAPGSGGSKISSGTIVVGNVNYYAYWIPNTFTVSYDANGGSGAPEKQIFEKGIDDMIITSVEPVREGYTFMGWGKYTHDPVWYEVSSWVDYKPGDVYNEDYSTTLYAVWKTNLYTVSFSTWNWKQSKEHDKDLILTEDIPSRTGYTFLGWSVRENGDVEYQPGDTYKKNVDVTLYAVWETNPDWWYTVSYDANGGSWAPEAQIKYMDKDIIIDEREPIREGYTFRGWATGVDERISYQPGFKYSKNASMTLYAIWRITKYSVYYYPMGGSGAPEGQIKTHGQELVLSNTKPTRTGYTFLGWSLTENGKVDYKAGAIYKEEKAASLHAVWDLNNYKVTYDANGGSGAPAAQTKTYGTALTLISTKPTRSGYTFQGWATTKDGSVVYQPGDGYTANKAVTLYAVWKANTYKVKYDANGGTGAPSAQTKTYGKTLTLSSAKPTRSGYAFQGWATTKDGSVAYQPGDAYKANKAVTLYAVWKSQKFAITSQPKAASAYVGDTAKFSVSATGAGLKYNWQYSSNNGKSWKSCEAFAPDLALKVKANQNSFLFRCVITDANGKTLNSNTAKLTVKSKITKQPVNQTCYEDETVPFTITATGPGLKYKWQFSRDGGANWSSWHTLQNIDVKAFGDRHGYLFRCIITDENGVTLTSKTVKLSINSKMIAQPKNVSVVVGGEAQFSVKASGPVLRYKWYMSKDNGKNWSYWAGRPSFSTTAVAARNGYLFKCEITGANDQTLNTKTVKLTVLPKISKQPADQSVALGKDAVFQAGAQGAGLQYKWYMSKDEGNTWNYYAAGSKLTVTGTKNRNGYLFRCEITDANGKVLTSNTARLTVK